jgi:hypothetical protein
MMTNNYEIKAAIKGELQVGDAEKNKFNLSIQYNGQETVKLKHCTFKFFVDIGPEPTALVLNKDAAEDIEISFEADIEIEPVRPKDKNKFGWEINSYSDLLFNDNPIEIEFSNIKSQTEKGTASFTLESNINDHTQSQELNLEKKSDQAGIVYFYSTTEERRKDQTTPESIAPADEKIRPGQKVILKWCVNKLYKLKLEKNGVLEKKLDSDKDKGEIEIPDIREKTDFVLSGRDEVDDEQVLPGKVTVYVLDPGWHESTRTHDGDELEPTILFNANNQTLYAVFRRQSGDNNEKGLLFQTGNPFWGWTLINSSVPADCITSPGVYHDDRLWFIGGSQIDPDNTSNCVWCFDPQKEEWQDCKAADWTPRMGHAVLVYNNEILIMGGCDQNGNTLDDVWSYDVSNETWSEKREMKLPTKLCMFGCAVFEKEIWLYGGREDDPLSDNFSSGFKFYDESEKKWKGKRDINAIKPMNACLQVFDKKLICIGKTSGLKSFHYRLNEPTTWDWAPQRSDALNAWGENRTSSYQLINFDDRLLIAKALGYEKPEEILKIHVPED